MMWLFFSIVFLFFAGLYIWITPFRQGVHNIIIGCWYWALATFNFPAWFTSFAGWLGRVWTGFINGVVWIVVRVLWILGILTIAYAYAASHATTTGNPVLLYVVMGVNVFLLLLIAQFSSTLARIFSTSRGATRNLAIIFMFYCLHIAGLATWTEQYLAHMWAIIGLSLLVAFFFHGFGIWRGLPPAIAGWTMLVLFVALFISALVKPEIKTIYAEREIDKQKKETSLPAKEVEKDYAKSWTTGKVLYQCNIVDNTGTVVDSLWAGTVLRVNPKDTLAIAGVPHFKVRFYVAGKMRREGWIPFDLPQMDASLDWSNPVDVWEKQKEAELLKPESRVFTASPPSVRVINNTGEDRYGNQGKMYFPQGEYEIPIDQKKVFVVVMPKKFYITKEFDITQN